MRVHVSAVSEYVSSQTSGHVPHQFTGTFIHDNIYIQIRQLHCFISGRIFSGTLTYTVDAFQCQFLVSGTQISLSTQQVSPKRKMTSSREPPSPHCILVSLNFRTIGIRSEAVFQYRSAVDCGYHTYSSSCLNG